MAKTHNVMANNIYVITISSQTLVITGHVREEMPKFWPSRGNPNTCFLARTHMNGLRTKDTKTGLNLAKLSICSAGVDIVNIYTNRHALATLLLTPLCMQQDRRGTRNERQILEYKRGGASSCSTSLHFQSARVLIAHAACVTVRHHT